MRPSALALCLLFGVGTATQAQRGEPETGTVTGRVLCSDTNGPARIASVVLVPIVDTSFLKKPNAPKDAEEPRETGTKIIQTGLDGTFLIPKVRPGNYYLVPQESGYLQPLALLTREQLNKPDEDTAKLIARLLTPVTVAAHRNTQVEARLIRGAAISGTIRYDDGTPVIGSGVAIFTKNKEGKWKPLRTQNSGSFGQLHTDDQGRYRLAGLPAGEYLLATKIELTELYVSGIFGDNQSSSWNPRYELQTYYGDTFREKTAKSIKVGEGEQAGDLNLTVNLATMHALSGTILTAGAHTVNAAKVALLWNDDNTELVSTKVRPEDNSFHFDYVPEGEYTLRVTEARDVTREEISNGPNSTPPTHTQEKTVKSYGDADQPLILHTDIQALTITVPPTTPKPQTTATLQ